MARAFLKKKYGLKLKKYAFPNFFSVFLIDMKILNFLLSVHNSALYRWVLKRDDMC